MAGRKDGPPRGPDLGTRDQVRRLKRGMERSAQQVLRCQRCGDQELAEAAFVGPRTRCSSCDTALHSCKHCVHFDTRSRYQCRKPIPEPVTDKWAANSCDRFEPRLVLDSTGRRAGKQAREDPKAMFDSLFKNPGRGD